MESKNNLGPGELSDGKLRKKNKCQNLHVHEGSSNNGLAWVDSESGSAFPSDNCPDVGGV